MQYAEQRRAITENFKFYLLKLLLLHVHIIENFIITVIKVYRRPYSMRSLREKLFEIQGYWLTIAESRVGESLRNVLDLFIELMYIEPSQFILEFLQNAEDALMEAGRRGYFKIELYEDKLIISNNGKPFDENDLDCLCGIKSSKKPSLGYKGFIGIGWKSVYKVSDHVEIHSGEIAFEFNKNYWRSAEASNILMKYNLKPENVLWWITPIPIRSTEVIPESETRFIIHLTDRLKYHDIARTVEEFGPSLFLFLDYISKIIIIDHVKGEAKVLEWSTVSEESFQDSKVKRIEKTTYTLY